MNIVTEMKVRGDGLELTVSDEGRNLFRTEFISARCNYTHHETHDEPIVCSVCETPMHCGPFSHGCVVCSPKSFDRCLICSARRIDCCC